VKHPIIAGTLAAALILGAAFFMGSAALGCEGRTVTASWYGAESGNRTATGDYFDGSSMTAAMPSRKHFGERYRVTFRGKSVTVRINDLGPHKRLGRGIDLSRAAADKIGMRRAGVAKVCIERVR
jgi:rare lipoprotein A